ncbi:hypothetical protein [Stappia sp. WLB 29]|uniref:hypothetical protein n=1 Tax=Stappia sp. WLB 29 TaxID=2925220 RepID=UPI0020C01E75|nr:hypothetical protein [Stappia sp. WLB 29]
MGTVLNFHCGYRPGRLSRRAMPRGRHVSAEIVIFPGVRVEHHDDVQALDLGARIGRKQDSLAHPGLDRDPGKAH